nr:iron-containing alcohol dehydrogenase [Bacteroidota bacterium]
MNFNYYLPTEIIFGCGKVKELNRLIDKGTDNILIVTDKNVFEKSGAQGAVLNRLKDFRIEIFDEVEENPSFRTLIKGTKIAKESNAQLILGIGGGSPMDAAKGIAAFATNEVNVNDFFEGDDLSKDPLPVVCLPTTSGTGSEVTPYAIFTDMEKGKKVCFSKPGIFPKFSIIDPELSYSMPEHVAINTGVDALTHAIEAYLSLQTFPMNDLFAIEAVKTVLENLTRASQKDKVAMNKLAYASMQAGISITHASTILLHIMAYPLTVFHGIPHGKANAILLPAFLEFMKRKSFLKQKVNTIWDMFEEFGGVNNFITGLNIPTRLSSYGIRKEEFKNFARDTIIKDDIKITPAEVTEEDIIEIYTSTF